MLAVLPDRRYKGLHWLIRPEDFPSTEHPEETASLLGDETLQSSIERVTRGKVGGRRIPMSVQHRDLIREAVDARDRSVTQLFLLRPWPRPLYLSPK
ncbi:hypothetical protein [Devosia ginsengisoli]|uniref:hypothetical protein n=1 Tax=Devosia ginsengisoli TaxID=400770 RepID=UPI0026EA5C07|nr:hypothetical protein [Devosia ginsengisoli]MCR6671282.1 hypothetical protein [Devosia ginsengisoli]